MKARLFILSILLLAACQQIEEPFDPRDNNSANKDGMYTLTIQATKSDAVTKALALDGNTLKSYWTNDDKVRVFKNNEFHGFIKFISLFFEFAILFQNSDKIYISSSNLIHLKEQNISNIPSYS